MIYECEHNKGSMFAVGPCDECRNRLDGFRTPRSNKQTRVHCLTPTDNESNKRTFTVKWADIHQVIPDVEEVTFIPRITRRRSKPILKHRVSCVVVVHES